MFIVKEVGSCTIISIDNIEINSTPYKRMQGLSTFLRGTTQANCICKVLKRCLTCTDTQAKHVNTTTRVTSISQCERPLHFLLCFMW